MPLARTHLSKIKRMQLNDVIWSHEGTSGSLVVVEKQQQPLSEKAEAPNVNQTPENDASAQLSPHLCYR